QKGVIRVKLQSEVATQVGNKEIKARNGQLTTGVRSLDAVSAKAKVKTMRRVFPYAPKYEARMALYGLDRWYEVTFDETKDPEEVKAMFAGTSGVQMATVKKPMSLRDGSGAYHTVSAMAVERPSTMPFNDPRLSSQWHYNNTGALSGSRAGADINLFEAWKTTTGKSDVIVAIIDGGIDYTHEDLAANVLINEAELNGTAGVDDDGNGYVDDVYGWNFCTNGSDVYPHNHGTHVAGTVAAVNNNGIGVCGVAGGDGTPGSGVRMLSAQVFDSRSGSGNADYAAAIVYAANRGASLANCSWGWAEPDYYEQDVLDAIDYFVGTKASVEAEAGIKSQRNLAGGVMFFATGNDGATGNFYPACYENVVAVGSMINDYSIAPYSNYGSWVDIVAPGGLVTYGSQGGVLSTLPNDTYGFNEGTSMATPHVTGVAALVVSQHGNPEMSAETIRQQILTSVNDIYEYNPAVSGLHGVGYIDAVKALQMNAEGEAPESITDFSLLPAQDNITVEWVIPNSSTGNVNHHILYYSTTEFTESELGTVSNVVIDTKFANSGETFQYELSGLKSLTTYYVAIKGVDRWGNAAALSPVKSATTNAGPKMTVDKTSLTMTVDAASSLTGVATFNIGNTDEGLLKWSGKIATKSYAAATKSVSSNRLAPGAIGKLKSRLGATQYANTSEKFNTSDYKASEYPRSFKYYDEYWASIGEEDKTLPNSQAQYFYIDPDFFPEGFNLTHVEIYSTYGKNPTVQIYKGGGALTPANMLQEIKPYFYSGVQVQLEEQLFFGPEESFWVVVHYPAESNSYGYQLGLGKSASGAAGFSYMSCDGGATWTPLTEALKGSAYESLGSNVSWAIAAMSKNPAWDKVFSLNPSEGIVKQGESQSVNIENDGQKLVNGTYKFNVSFTTNESDKNGIVLPVTVTVKNNLPEMSAAKIVNFSSLLVGESKTVEVEVFNEGYGVFTGNYGYLQSSSWSISNDAFSLKDVPTNGFPARSSSKFKIIYSPKSAGTHTGVITFKSATGVEFKVTVQGVAIDPAKIVVEPAVTELGDIIVDADAIESKFTIKNEGNYPLEYVFPKFSDHQIEASAGKASHKFGYSSLTNLGEATDFTYDGNPELIGETEVTSTFTDNVKNTKSIALGFDFPFYGKTYTEVYINSLGGLSFSLGEYSYFPPLTPTSSSLEGVAYISAYGHQLQFGPNSHVTYAKQDGKFVVKYDNVLAVKYDVETSPISFRIMLSANGDIEIFYDDYVRTEMGYDDWGYETEVDRLFQGGSTLFCGIKDESNADALVLTSADIADYWGTSEDPAGQLYKQFQTQTSVKFAAPAPYFVKGITPAYGIVSPGESVEVTAAIQGDETMVAGDITNRLAIETNDPNNATAYATFNARIIGDLQPEITVVQETIDFGQVFRNSDAKAVFTVKNTGREGFVVESASIISDVFAIDFASTEIKPGMSKDFIVTMNTANEGIYSAKLNVVYTGDVTKEYPITGEVIGSPEADLNITEISETVESGASLSKELTITNSGNETLVYSIVPGSFTSVNDPSVSDAKVSYIYSASVDDENVKYEWVDIENGLGERNGFSYYNAHDYLEVNLPFAFPFYGQEYTKLYIYNTGFVSFTQRSDEKIWPEPPADFPTGSIYTNIIAPYWGLHTMDTNATAGTYHYMTENEVVVSWMEYGNSMNIGVCYQLIMRKDGSFKYQYKGVGDYAIIYGTFGLAGACNEGGSQYFVIPDRYIQFGNAVQFSPVAESSIEPSSSKTVSLNVDTDKMAGDYSDAVTINTNVPHKEKIEVPVNITITGEANPVWPETLSLEHVAGYQEIPTEESGPGVQYMGAPYEIQFKVENSGTAAMTIVDIAYDSPVDDMEYPLFMLMAQMVVPDWLTGETSLQWQVYEYYRGMPIEVTPSQPLLLSMPMSWDCYATIGEYSLPMTFTYTLDGENYLTQTVDLKFVVTDIPELWLDKTEIAIVNAAPDYKGEEALKISNEGNYKLTYTLRLDMTGAGETPEEGESGGGVSPMSVNGELSEVQLAELQANLNNEIKPLAAPTNFFDGPSDFDYNNILFHTSIDNLSYSYGTGNTYGKYISATHFVAPEEGFNLSHVYFATQLNNSDGSYITNAEFKVEIVAGDDYENGNVIGKGTLVIDKMD
ncbi:MAG: S8 family serine peptidase, partial [Muribaculaceae bacterium]